MSTTGKHEVVEIWRQTASKEIKLISGKMHGQRLSLNLLIT
jgi:hypothetical protein